MPPRLPPAAPPSLAASVPSSPHPRSGAPHPPCACAACPRRRPHLPPPPHGPADELMSFHRWMPGGQDAAQALLNADKLSCSWGLHTALWRLLHPLTYNNKEQRAVFAVRGSARSACRGWGGCMPRPAARRAPPPRRCRPARPRPASPTCAHSRLIPHLSPPPPTGQRRVCAHSGRRAEPAQLWCAAWGGARSGRRPRGPLRAAAVAAAAQPWRAACSLLRARPARSSPSRHLLISPLQTRP